MKKNPNLLLNAMIAALYAVLTIGLAPLSYGPVQIRLSECMTLLAFYNRKLIPGLTIGCLLANIGSPYGLPDMVIGTAATFMGLYTMRYCHNLLTASLMPVLSNGILIGLELWLLAQLPPRVSVIMTMLYIGLGELLSVTLLGSLVIQLLLKNDVLNKLLCEKTE
jgi:uncharacterized membrane protein